MSKGPRSPLALVESPSQLLSAAEWAAASGGAEAAVLLPSDAATRAQLAALAPAVVSAGLTVSTYDVRGGAVSAARELPSLVARVNRAPQLLLGDPFSFLVQSLLLSCRATSIVVLDDGTATFELADRLRDGGPLVRWHGRGRSSLTGARAARRIAPGRGRDIELYTCLPVGALPSGVRLRPHRYAWLRGFAGPPEQVVGVDIVGCSLVESGLIREQPYLDDVAAVAHRSGARRYWAHRRESEAKLRVIASFGLEVVLPDVPLELAARRGPVATTWITYPSTAAHTLPMVLVGVDPMLLSPTMIVRPVEDGWYTAAASPTARMFINRVTTSIEAQHELFVA